MYSAPPTVARFRAACAVPLREAFADIPDADIEVVAEQHADELMSALGDRATLPILEWDSACDGAVRALMCRTLMAHNGYRRDASVDQEIVRIAERADGFLSRCRPGAAAPGKSENPRFIDSGGNKPLDSIRVVSERTSDAFLLGASRCRRCC